MPHFRRKLFNLHHNIHLIKKLFFPNQIVSDANLDDTWRQLALEVIVTMSETAPAMVRKYAKFIPLLGKVLSQVILH